MPRPGNRARSPPRDVPFGDPTADLNSSLEKIGSPARFGGKDSSFEATGRVGTGLKGQRTVIKNGKLRHKPLNNEVDDKYEYYTSEDEHGRRIQKMRKKKRKGNRSKDAAASKGMGSTGTDFNKTGGNRARSLTMGSGSGANTTPPPASY